jgi:hypothetical protein
MTNDKFEKTTGSELQESQSGGKSGRFGGNRDGMHRSGQAGGGADSGLAGGDLPEARGAGISRGERYDEAANGGRGAAEVSPSSDALEFAGDQRDHQDRGQSEAEEEFNRDAEA